MNLFTEVLAFIPLWGAESKVTVAGHRAKYNEKLSALLKKLVTSWVVSKPLPSDTLRKPRRTTKAERESLEREKQEENKHRERRRE